MARVRLQRRYGATWDIGNREVLTYRGHEKDKFTIDKSQREIVGTSNAPLHPLCGSSVRRLGRAGRVGDNRPVMKTGKKPYTPFERPQST
jgi:hypothetical protein